MLLPLIRSMLQRLLSPDPGRSQCRCGCDEQSNQSCDGSSIASDEDLDCAPVLVPMRLAFVVDEDFAER
jgi:hypothetical protein